MSRRLPVLKAREVVRALQKAGFQIVRTKGSHRVLVHSTDKRRTVIVPEHGPRDVPTGTLRSIIDQSGLTVDEFVAFL